MKRLVLCSALLAVVFCIGLESASAVPIVEYDIANANAATSNTVNKAFEDANVAASTLMSIGALGAPFNFGGTFCYFTWPTGGALSPTEYYEFSIAPDAGFEIQYTDIDLAVASGGSGTGTFEIHASLDGFTGSDITLATQNFPINGTWQAYNLNIAALGTQPSNVTFRFYMYNIPSAFSGLGVNPTFGPNGRNLSVNGNVQVIPEPSTYLLFAVGILAIFGIGYRQRKKAA